MSSAQIGNLQVALGINTAQFAAGLAQARGSLSSFEGSLKSFAAGIAGALSLGAVTAVLKSSIDHMDELGKAAQKIGIPTEELSKLEYAAKLADVSLDDLTTTLAKFSKNIAELQAGGRNDTGQGLKALGISALDAQGKLRPTIEIFGDIADKFQNMQDGAGKTALAIALLGKSGAEMIPLLNGGRDALKEAAAQAQSFGTVVSEQAAAAAETLNDNLTRMQEVTNGVFQQIAIGMLPAVVKVTDALVTYAEKGDIANTVSDAMSWVMKNGAKAAVGLNREISELTTMVNFLATATDLVKKGDFAGVAAAWGEAAAQNRKNLEGYAAELERISSATQEVAPGKGDLPSSQRTKPSPIIPQLSKPASSPVPKIPKDTIDSIYGAGEAFQTLWDRMAEGMPDVNILDQSFQSLAASISDSLGNAIEGLIMGTMSVKDALKSMAQSVSQTLSQLAAEIIKSGILRLISMLVSSLGGGGWVGGSYFGNALNFRAAGGPVNMGSSYIVGEKGPELFTPNGSGYITPNNKLGGGSSPVNVTVINNSSASVNARKNTKGDLEIMVEDMLAEKLIRGGNKIDAALARGYGLRRSGRS